MTVGALLQLGGDELRAAPGDHVLLETLGQLVEHAAVAKQEALVEDRGADRHVFARQLHALVDRAEGMADLQPHVPQRIEHVLDDALGPGGLLVVAHEQEIDVGGWRQHAAAITADRDHRHALGLGRVVGAEDVDDREIVERRQRLIHHGRHQRRGVEAVRPLLQPVLRDHAAAEQGGVDQVERALALGDRVGAVVERGGGQLDAQLAAIDDVGNPPRAGLDRARTGRRQVVPSLRLSGRGVVHGAMSSPVCATQQAAARAAGANCRGVALGDCRLRRAVRGRFPPGKAGAGYERRSAGTCRNGRDAGLRRSSAVKRSLWQFPTGIVGTALASSSFWQGQLYSSAVLQLFFIVVQVYGWWYWMRGDKGTSRRPSARTDRLAGRHRRALAALASPSAAPGRSTDWTDAEHGPSPTRPSFGLSVVAQYPARPEAGGELAGLGRGQRRCRSMLYASQGIWLFTGPLRVLLLQRLLGLVGMAQGDARRRRRGLAEDERSMSFLAKPKRGFVLGKFMPPHAGHVYLCDFGRAYVEELTILVCSAARRSDPRRAASSSG